MRTINISNSAKRNAEVVFTGISNKNKLIYKTQEGKVGHNERRLKTTLATSEEMLLSLYGDDILNALVTSDPDVDMERCGMAMDELKKVYITESNKVAYGVNLNEHIFFSDGTLKEVRPKSLTVSNVAIDSHPVRWSGKMIPRNEAVRKFIFKRSYQLSHINGLTFDFLYNMAKQLHEADAMMLLGAGTKGVEPLVVNNGGIPYRAFLEGRVTSDGYALILRLTNMEVKSIIDNN